MIVFTSITGSYLAKARVLAKSLRRHNPDWQMVVVWCDGEPYPSLEKELFQFVPIADLGIPEWKAWTFGHELVELCTAVKAHAALELGRRFNSPKIIYLDPDIKVFSSLSHLDALLDQHDIVLTPHLLDPETSLMAISDNEICALQHGTFNLGFFGVRMAGQGLQFLRWWEHRLRHYCVDDIPSGLFTDQRWCDLAPAFFDRLHIIRDRGYNVATWNIQHRPISQDSTGTLFAAADELRFYHFTGFDSGAGATMLSRYASDQNQAESLWRSYMADLEEAGQSVAAGAVWAFATYSNGEKIPREARQVYRARRDLQIAFPDPFQVGPSGSFFQWWHHEHSKVLPAVKMGRPRGFKGIWRGVSIFALRRE